jgi:hypothetical protein
VASGFDRTYTDTSFVGDNLTTVELFSINIGVSSVQFTFNFHKAHRVLFRSQNCLLHQMDSFSHDPDLFGALNMLDLLADSRLVHL